MDRRELVACLLDEAGRHHSKGHHRRALRCEGAAARIESEEGAKIPDDALDAWLEGWEAGESILRAWCL